MTCGCVFLANALTVSVIFGLLGMPCALSALMIKFLISLFYSLFVIPAVCSRGGRLLRGLAPVRCSLPARVHSRATIIVCVPFFVSLLLVLLVKCLSANINGLFVLVISSVSAISLVLVISLVLISS